MRPTHKQATLRAEELFEKSGPLGGTVFPPMLATLVERPPASERGERWQLELKYDGFRTLAAIGGGDFALRSRNALDMAERFPLLGPALLRLGASSALLDGEAAVLDDAGVPRFQLLQQQGGSRAVLFVFDLLWIDGEDLRSRPLPDRWARLSRLLADAPPNVQLAERLRGPFERALDEARQRGFEGVIGKRLDSTWRSGRSRDWIKLKVETRQEVAIVGFTPHSAMPRHIGALLVGVVDPRAAGALVYAGKVGTGFDTQQRASLYRRLAPDAVPAPSRARSTGAPRDATWVAPQLVCEVRFTEWTADDKLRHPVFLGLRPDKSPLECVRERPSTVH